MSSFRWRPIIIYFSPFMKCFLSCKNKLNFFLQIRIQTTSQNSVFFIARNDILKLRFHKRNPLIYLNSLTSKCDIIQLQPFKTCWMALSSKSSFSYVRLSCDNATERHRLLSRGKTEILCGFKINSDLKVQVRR